MKALLVIACIILLIVLLLHVPVCLCLKYAEKVIYADIKYFFYKMHIEAGLIDGKFQVKLPEKKKKKKRRRKKPKDGHAEVVDADTAEIVSADTAEETAPEEETAEEKPPADDAHPQFEGVDITYIDEKEDEQEEEEEKKALFDKLDELGDKLDSLLMLWELNKKYLFRIIGSVRVDDVLVSILAAGSDAHRAAITYGTANAVVWNAISLTRTFFRVTLLGVDIKCSFDEDERTKATGSCIIKLRPSAVIHNGTAMLFVTLINFKKIFPNGLGTSGKKKKRK